MLTYPVLNERSIDQWSIMELKDELCRRNLPIIGLKDDLVKRLFEDLQGNILGGEGTGGGATADDDLKEDSTSGSADTTIGLATMEQSVDEVPSQVATQEGDLVVSFTEDSKERAVATTDVNEEAVVTTDEISQTTLVAAAEVVVAPLVDVATTDKVSLCDTVATKRDDLGSTPSHGTIVKEVYAQADGHSAITAEKASEEGTSKKIIADDLPSDVASIDVKLDATSALGKLDADILEHKALSSPLDAIAPTVPCGVDAVATAPRENAVTLIPINSGDLKDEKTPSSSGASICQAVMDHIVDEGHSQEGDHVVSVTEASKESAVATTDVNHEVSVTTGEVSRVTLVAAIEVTDAPLVDVAITKISLSDAVATKGDDLGSTPSDGTIVKEVYPQADGHSEIIAEKYPEKGTRKKMSVDDLPSDAANIDVVYAASVKDKLSSDVLEHKAVSSRPETIAPHATAPGQNADTFILKIDSGDNASMNDNQHDSGHTIITCQPTLSRPEDQVSEASSDLGSQIKCVLISHDNISTNVMGNLNADSSDLELEAKRDMVKPPSNIPSVGDHLQAFNHDKEFSKNDISFQQVQSTTSMNLDKKEISHNGGSPENLDLDRSSGDEMMEDVMESKHVDPNIKSGDLGGKNEFTNSDYEVKEVILIDTVTNDSSVHTKAIAAEGKAVTPSEKRKPEAQEFLANKPIKRQRHVYNLKIPKQQACGPSGSDAPKDVFQPALKHSFGRSDSTESGEAHKVHIVQPSLRPATTSLRVDRFVRPFTLKAVQELLGRTGSVCGFWMDHIKTHCYVTYSSVEEAVATRNAVYNLQWPPNNVPIRLSTDTVPKAAPFHQAKANQMMAASRGLLPTPQSPMMLPPTSTPGSGREMLPPPPKEPVSDTAPLSLDELFKRTQASPRIFYLPLSEEEMSAKLAARSKGKRGG
ncbi:apoptotic chromatin condensation inducer in the nucleus isoform X2 [Brachypodium distachyon]|uniref:SAP domain-containing protein n=1 Tax=Brachypodium distachyon TaxID=15368 RepID=A0A0Q3NDB0_BRADI|nr:apoptotic chromatin condensation inducer in the nucleus isoform X2 [Brachypodium distachyon]KQK15110.1 hypothetical protein BRADI_1g20715v3 [Brachypodium distachyon]|eukprot:XP_010235274.1 apoptotic chromatin condensation inducer in the nucleus isoform X2 [Brachypodium distachyon]